MSSRYATKEYIEMLRAMHAAARWGASGKKYVNTVLPFYDELKCTSLLDYGSGAGTIRTSLQSCRSDIDVRCYDPGVIGCEAEPSPADLVVCTDVLEHVEGQFVSNVLNHIHSLAKVGCFLNIALVPAKRILPDGRNAHITLKPSTWWLAKIEAYPWSSVKYDARKKHVLVWLIK